MLDHLTKDVFAEQLNTTFHIYFTPEEATATELIEVSEPQKPTPLISFSLLFLAPIETVFEQRIYKIEHAELGAFELFIVPIEREEKGIVYEAIFSRRNK